MSWGGSHGKFAKREGRQKDKYLEATDEGQDGCKFDNNSFEHDYILRILEMLVKDLATAKPVPGVLDSTACQLTAFMQGQVAAEVKRHIAR